MKKVNLLGLLLICIPLIQYAQNTSGIEFQEDSWRNILKKAKTENKYIFIDAFTTWCGPCKMMDRDVYANDKVGALLNENFISVKVQMDSTQKDNGYVKSWYKDVELLKNTAKIEAYPSFIFFSSDGDIVYKSFGYKTVENFISMVHFATDPKRKDFKSELLAYQNGMKDYTKMPALAKTVIDLLGDRKLSFLIAKDYKDNYLDKLTTTEFMKAVNIRFINENGGPSLVSLNDQMFYNCYYNPSKIDLILGVGSSKRYINSVITTSLITPLLYKENKPITKKPNWGSIKIKIAKKYKKVDCEQLILNSKIGFYKRLGDWNLYTLFKSEQIRANPPKPEGLEVFFSLNAPAWDVFLHCNDKRALKRALQWSDLSITLEERGNPSGGLQQYFDTRANLLYKLGRVSEAIAAEEKAIELDQPTKTYVKEFESNIEKMKRGIPTWNPSITED